ncbi:hypothetical protein BDCR2A_01130 [Borrelia duttonii CR2A]|uniref:Uncharacterized protein n=1 Tax=Borrelia duttonii CR2A TaxID=1432657 RepID=W6THD2_9SPIR|nr:hypothetical protein BDCR2A_01130 [Borrelia duttonii CR2A]
MYFFANLKCLSIYCVDIRLVGVILNVNFLVLLFLSRGML